MKMAIMVITELTKLTRSMVSYQRSYIGKEG